MDRGGLNQRMLGCGSSTEVPPAELQTEPRPRDYEPYRTSELARHGNTDCTSGDKLDRTNAVGDLEPLRADDPDDFFFGW